jgi:hypothetical protein
MPISLKTVAEVCPLLFIALVTIFDKYAESGSVFFYKSIENLKDYIKNDLSNHTCVCNKDCMVFCPINGKEHLDKESYKNVANISKFWNCIQLGFSRQSQASFFEAISFQFLIITI